MLLRKIVIEGFKPFQDRIEVDLTHNFLPEGKKNVVLIGGMNGGGKTSLLEAINLCLYGAKNSIIFNWFNRNNAGQHNYAMYVSLTFQDEANIFEISRSYFIPAKLSSPTYSDIQQKLHVTLDKKDSYETFDAQEQLENFLSSKIPKNISPFFFFDGEKIQDIVEAGFSRDDIRESVEALLGIELFKRLQEDLKKVISDERKAYKNISNDSVHVREAEIEKKKQELQEIDEDLSDIIKEISESEEEKEQLQQIFEERFGRYPEVIEEKKKLEIDRKSLGKEDTKIDNVIDDFCKNRLALILLTNLLPDLKDQIEKEKRIKREQKNYQEKHQLIDTIIKELFEDECILCKQPTQFDKKTLFQEINSRLFPSPPPLKQNLLLDLSDKEESKILAIHEEENYREILDIKECLKRKEIIISRLQTIEKRLSNLELEAEEQQHLEEMQKKLSELDKCVGRRKEEESNLRDRKHRLQEEIAIKERDLDKAYEKHEQKKETNRLVSYTTKLHQVIEKYVEIYRTQKIQELQKNLSKIFTTIFAKHHLIQDIAIDERTFHITIRNTKHDRIDYRSFSAGEKEIFAISFLWALSKTSHLELPIIIDTPLARLDHIYRQSLIQYYFPFASKQVIILSQDEEIEPESELYHSLKPYIYLEKTLQYDDLENKTLLHDGYFRG